MMEAWRGGWQAVLQPCRQIAEMRPVRVGAGHVVAGKGKGFD